ncbi:SIR2 family protein [Anaeromicropila populeti]|uniref:Mu-like prophage protein Com n=1 Tax=Anaeromicropila populeti TaxID=37658 RepID=A0A1I6LE10_9FIRM|nr:hypothetical protein [Anaeromicropila populeti]SFS01508.1 hypothetical protein SAMN05661086_03237 [Anaeromicropila populeti]
MKYQACCINCGQRLFDFVKSDTKMQGQLEMKCPRCKQIVVLFLDQIPVKQETIRSNSVK